MSGDTTAHERLVAALKASRAGTWRWDIRADLVDWDEALCAVYGLPHEQAPRSSGAFLQLIHPEDRERAGRLLGALLEKGSEIEYEFRAVVGDRIVWIYDRSTLTRDAEGQPAYMTGACLDVTARKQIEEERNAAHEKHRLLLRELNHRVTNHLQMITAMLALQAAGQAEASVRADFEKAIQRIHTLAGLHTRLYRDQTFDAIDMHAYLADICDGLRGAVLPDSHIELECAATPIRLSTDQAVLIGLIVSELATNAVKYAFPPGRAGKIVVQLDPDGDHAVLSVADDGVGVPTATGKAGSGIGLGMVKGLAQQIGGTLSIESGGGTAYRLRFKADQPASQAGAQ
ncbi:MAG: PAS domain-containing protein [Alphaproteobacteria bacterium]|nr:PAS domain-containing protein [Alphaproteobacteria bacterium]